MTIQISLLRVAVVKAIEFNSEDQHSSPFSVLRLFDDTDSHVDLFLELGQATILAAHFNSILMKPEETTPQTEDRTEVVG